MNKQNSTFTSHRAGVVGATMAAAGVLLSGPVGLAITDAIAPQPPWQGGRTFALAFNAVQTLPFVLGISLVIGLVTIVVALHESAEPRHRVAATMAVVFSAVFAALIFFNYIVQTTFVPVLARHYTPDNDAALVIFSMSNPHSLAWALEMWGYGIYGLATWCIAPVLSRTPLERTAALLMRTNAIVSVVGAILTAIDQSWVFSVAGFVSYAAWNVVVLAMAGVMVVVFRRRGAT